MCKIEDKRKLLTCPGVIRKNLVSNQAVTCLTQKKLEFSEVAESGLRYKPAGATPEGQYNIDDIGSIMSHVTHETAASHPTKCKAEIKC